MSFANQVAVITGASSGLGWALSKELSSQGCRVGLLARRQDKLDALAQEIRAAEGTAVTVSANVADREQTIAGIHALRDQLGPVDLLIACAGIGLPTQMEPLNLEQVENMFKVNTLGVVYAIAGVLPEMLQRGRGHLVAISSLAAYKGLPGESGYCASKAAVSVYMEGLRIQLRLRGIHVTTVCPGFIQTPMTDVNTFHMPLVMSAEKAARLIVSAIGRKRKVFNFPWRMTMLMKLTRWLPDWIMARSMKDYTGDRPHPPE